jgi:hypothetical protein
MSKRAPLVGFEAIDLLFSIVEMPNAIVTGAVLADYYNAVAPTILGAGLLVPDGHEGATASLADHDDVPVTLTWSPGCRGYGYFSPAVGWVSIPNDRITRYRANLTSFIEHLLNKIDWPSRRGPIPLIPDVLWEIGDVRIEGRAKRVSLWLGRRFHDPTVWARVTELMRARPAPGLRVVLVSTPADKLPKEAVFGHLMVSVRDVLDRGAGLAVDPVLLAARIAGSHRRGDRPLAHSADYSVITVHRKDYAFTGKQRGLVRQLVEAFEVGSPRCLTAKVLEEADYASSVNTLAKAFSKRTDWRDFIAEGGGTCWIFI